MIGGNNAGRVFNVAPGATVTLDGTASIDRNGTGLRAAWRIIDGPGTLRDADSLTARFDGDRELSARLTAALDLIATSRQLTD